MHEASGFFYAFIQRLVGLISTNLEIIIPREMLAVFVCIYLKYSVPLSTNTVFLYKYGRILQRPFKVENGLQASRDQPTKARD